MIDSRTMVLNGTSGVYRGLVKPVLFRFDPESVHDRTVKLAAWTARRRLLSQGLHSWLAYENPALSQNLHGIEFTNPLGLAAGFDKQAQLIDFMPLLGFGFTEIGSVTAFAHEGNLRPRLWRLPQGQGLAVNYGLKNLGARATARILEDIEPRIPLGVNIAMTNHPLNTGIRTAVEDYRYSLRTLRQYADYITVNVSCPNTCNEQPFTASKNLERLLSALQPETKGVPTFVKIGPDLASRRLDSVIRLLLKYGVDGIICSNLTKVRPEAASDVLPEKGGLSGGYVRQLSDRLIHDVYARAGDSLTIVGLGGIASPEDAYEKIKHGASLLQLITGMIYQGPQLVGQINRGLAELLEADGYERISDAVGAYHR